MAIPYMILWVKWAKKVEQNKNNMTLKWNKRFPFNKCSWIKLWEVSRIKMNKQWIDISIICVFFLTCFNLFNLDGYFKSNILLFFLTIYTFFFLNLIDFFFLKFNRLSFWILIYFLFWKLVSFPFWKFWKYLYFDF